MHKDMAKGFAQMKKKALEAFGSDELNGIFKSLAGLDPDSNDVDNNDILEEKMISLKDMVTNYDDALLSITYVLGSCGYYCDGMDVLQAKTSAALRDVFVWDESDLRRKYFDFKKSVLVNDMLIMASNVQKSSITVYPINADFYNHCTMTTKKFNIMSDVSTAGKSGEVNLVNIVDLNDLFNGSDISLSMKVRKKRALLKFLRIILIQGSGIKANLERPDLDADKMFKQLSEMIKNCGTEFKNCERGFELLDRYKGIFSGNLNKYLKSMGRNGSVHTLLTEYIADVVKEMEGAEDELSGSDSLKDIIHLKSLARKIFKKFNNSKLNSNPETARSRQKVKSMMEVLLKQISFLDDINLDDNEEDLETFEL